MRQFPKKIRIAAAALIVLGWLFLFRPASLGGPAGYVLVTGVSMEPTIRDGDLVVTRKLDRYETGDIVAFDVDGRVVIHRIVGGSAEEGFVMQGDNKDSVDSWHPKPADVVGKRWLRIPGLGRKIREAQDSPVTLGAVAGGLSTLAAAGPVRRRRRRRAPVGDPGTAPRARGRRPSRPPASSDFGARLVAFGAAVSLLGAATAVILARPAERVERRTSVDYTHQAAFEFTATMQPSTLYDSPVVSSRALPDPDPEDGGGRLGPPLYTTLLEAFEVDFAYTLDGAQPGAQGLLSAEVQVRAGQDGWVKTLPVLDPRPFDGNVASAAIPVDLTRIRSLIDAIEDETGTGSGAYDLVVMPRVEVTGRAGGETASEVYVPEFAMVLTDNDLRVNGERRQNEPVETTEMMRVANDVEVLGLSVAPRVARGAATGALTLLLVLGGVYVASELRRAGRGEVGRIRLRYSSFVVPLAGEVPNGVPHSQVTSMGDLVRLARRNEQLVFHHEPAPGDHRFFVPDGALTYEYRVDEQVDRA